MPSNVHLNKEDCPTTYELMDITSWYPYSQIVGAF
jgi:hypothetical protein